MAKRNIIWHETIRGEETLIYYLENQDTGKKRYYVLEAIPEQYQDKPAVIEKLRIELDKYNRKNNKHVEIVSLTNKYGEDRLFVREQTPAIKALAHKARLCIEFNAAKKAQERAVNSNEGGLISDETKCKPASQSTIKMAVASAMVVLVLVFGIILTMLNPTGSDNGGLTTPPQTTPPQITQQVTGSVGPAVTSGNNTIVVTPGTLEEKHIDLDSLTFATYESGSGATMLELSDSIKIADACFNNLAYELKNADHNYAFDISKFDSTMYTGEQIRESSLILTDSDINEQCRGPFKLGPAAIEEANEVSMKLTGRKIIETVEDLYDPVKSCMACMYMSVKNYQYCYNVVGDDVIPNMVFDTYLYGCGNVMKALREDLETGSSYDAKSYSKDILYYASCLAPYKEALESGITNGEHDAYWQNTYYNGLWKLPDWSKVEPNQGQEKQV